MKPTMLILMLMLVALVAPAMNFIATVNALHKPDIIIYPVYFDGIYPENKTFYIFNNNTAVPNADIITKVVIVFPYVNTTVDADFKPVAYSVKLVPAGENRTWSTLYERLLRQVTFSAEMDESQGIHRGENMSFMITLEDGPSNEGLYEWTVSTTDIQRDAHTGYYNQYIDTTRPSVTITFPGNNTDVDGFISVNAAVDPPTITDFTWVNGTASDVTSGLKSLELKLDNGGWFTVWSYSGLAPVHALNWSYQWWSPSTQPADHNVTARATDQVLLKNTAFAYFRYRLLIDRVTVGPTTTEGASGIVYGSIYKTVGTNYTISWTGMLSGLVTVSVYLRSYTSYNAAHGTYWVKVGNTTGSSLTFTFPTAPKGRYIVRASSSLTSYIVKIVDVVEGLVVEPDQIIGPATINTTATGLAALANSNTIALLCNDTDSLVGINYQTLYLWYTNGNGTLATTIALRTNHFVNTGFVMPTMQPGAYRIAVGATGDYWNASMPGWQSNTYSEAPNLDARQYPVHITVADTLPGIKASADNAAASAATAATAANNAVTAANNATTAANNAATAANNAVTAANNATTAANNAAAAATQANSTATDAKNAANNVLSAATDAETAANAAKDAANGMTIPLYLAVVLSLIAAIAAAVCAVLVFRKIA